MNAQQVTDWAQVSWLVLCGMMLVSRFAFRREGPVGMRAFLDAWKTSRTHRVWGVAAGLWGVMLGVLALRHWSALSWLDLLVVGSVVGVLCIDGLLNVLPTGFANFKERMQDAWVRRHEGTERASDEHLFGVVNLLLGVAATAVGVAVYAYRPIPWSRLVGVIAAATLLTFALIGACKREARRLEGSAPGRGRATGNSDLLEMEGSVRRSVRAPPRPNPKIRT